jgi:hypothetical protein
MDSFASMTRRSGAVIGLLLTAWGIGRQAHAEECSGNLPVSGVVTLPSCDPKKGACLSATEVLNGYLEKTPDDATLFQVTLRASPWRFYDSTDRVLPAADLAQTIKEGLSKKPSKKRVQLIASWSAVQPDPRTPSLTQKLSAAMGGVPTIGVDGFAWFKADGSWRTTRQATSIYSSHYLVSPGEDVMAAAADAAVLGLLDKPEATRDPEVLVAAGLAYDTFMLCPERALEYFRRASSLGSANGAWNAAQVLLDRGHKGDLEAAKGLLAAAAQRGDRAAAQALSRLERARPAKKH